MFKKVSCSHLCWFSWIWYVLYESSSSPILSRVHVAFTSLTYPTPQKYHIIYNTEILNNPLFNKFTAFKGGERDRLRFRGLLPPRRVNMQIQTERVLQEIRAEDSMIRKHTILEEVHDRNETLYHRILVDHM